MSAEVRGCGHPKLLPHLEGHGVARIIVDTRPPRGWRRHCSVVERDDEVRRRRLFLKISAYFSECSVNNVEGDLSVFMRDARARAGQQPSA
jgi:hypothetical protein